MSDLGIPMFGDEWQDWANQLLTEHYGPTNYVKIPDTEGDGGLEGFTRKEGHAFQAYGAEPGKTAKQLYDAQRNKMTEDINKFINNKKLLSKIIGTTKISCWALIVPVTSLKDLIAHTNKMTQKVLEANLPYVGEKFHVTVCDENHFASERNKLLAYKSEGICLMSDSADKQTVDEWMDGNEGLLKTLDQKLERLSTVATHHKRQQFRRDVLIWHIEGQNLLDKIREHSNISYEKIIRTKGQYEQILSSLQMSTTESGEIFKSTLIQFQEALHGAVMSLSVMNVKLLAHEAVSDWLLRCPLDFPNGDDNG